MYYITIDCGTTNSRVYVVDEKGTVLAKATKKVGVRNTSMTGSNACLREGLMETALPMMREIILEGMAENVFFTRFPDDIGELILQLFANITDELAMLIASGAPESDMGDMLTRLETYRCSIETLLGAPFGTITLCDLRLIPEVAAMVARG